MSKDRRIELQAVLEATLGSRNVYFQPPSTIKMQYPCIVYQHTDISTYYANNLIYKNLAGYTVTVIDSNPDSPIPSKILSLPYCRFNRRYTADNLNHIVFTIYY